ncbi:PLP-dependent aminotransferase family protein [Alcaligenes endophyticus]|uniref:PLP-dependent aminotransferase family protein n=1 Tax=Alcaligenes endophyticus TaxID=1929088 RepID=A0ABT8EMV0_9BURK|nr:PLP-dependent aminotransferase family protein [Alcaligenes endophyticus]MCX5591541.1 PLP-dependent aminotransferase family protein [Alcaligenes endophyticus]MDN4122578.1 PLP-dependent aminotransferase family protein [Alcaligenes endophyticus]
MPASHFTFVPERDKKKQGSLTEQIETSITLAIQERRLRPGMALPSIRKFAQQYDISTFTVANAYSRLVTKGWLSAKAGSAYRVAHKPRTSQVYALQHWQAPKLDQGWLLSDIFADQSIPVKAGCGWLPNEWLEQLGLTQAFRELATINAKLLTSYGHPYGYTPLREQICAEMHQHGLRAERHNVVMTRGATEAIDLTIRSLLRPGETVIVEAPCYANLLHMLRMAGLRVISVPRTTEGVDVQLLAEQIKTYQPRAICINTVLQNPTGSSMNHANALGLLKLLKQHDMLLIEDDVSRELLPGAGPLLATLEGLEKVIYIGGYSKSVSPSMRVGYVVASTELARQLVHTKMAVGLTSPEIMERVVLSIIQSSNYPEHLQHLRSRLQEAHIQVMRLMDERNFQIFERPKAGLFLWAKPPETASPTGANNLTQAALDDGIWLAPGSYFDSQEKDSTWMRFHVGYSHHPKLWQFLDHRLAKCRTPA